MNYEEEVVVCESRLLQAMRDCNLQVLGELLHDDLLFNGPTGEIVTKAMDLAVYQSGNMIVNENIPSGQKIRLFGDTAIVSVVISLKGEFMKKPVSGKFSYLRTWKKIDSQWKMIGGGCTPSL